MNHTNVTFPTVEPTNVSAANTSHDQHDAIQSDDATWILTSAFIIFTMQSGFGLLEAGMVSKKNETNIMVKNAVDVIYGSFAYWLFGYGLYNCFIYSFKRPSRLLQPRLLENSGSFKEGFIRGGALN